MKTNEIQVLFINFGEREKQYSLPFITKCREAKIQCTLYPKTIKMKDQMCYAQSKNIPFVVLASDFEMKQNKVTVKNMVTGEQILVNETELIAMF